MRQVRLNGLPEAFRGELKRARKARKLSQLALGKQVGLPQMHISGIETGKIVPRFDTLLDLVRVLDRDLLLVPRELVPAMKALIRDFRSASHGAIGEGARPLYAVDPDDDWETDDD